MSQVKNPFPGDGTVSTDPPPSNMAGTVPFGTSGVLPPPGSRGELRTPSPGGGIYPLPIVLLEQRLRETEHPSIDRTRNTYLQGIRITAAWILVAGVENFLRSLNASPDVIQYILEFSDKSIQSILANEVRKNPSISLNDLKKFYAEYYESTQRRKQFLQPTKEEKEILDRYDDDTFRKWLFVQIRKYRIGPPNPDGTYEYLSPLATTAERAKHIFKWYKEAKPDIASFDLPGADVASERWEQEHRKYKQKKVVYRFDNGWTIQEITTPDDLVLEGELMGHCVGNYCPILQKSHSRFYSLRDTNNRPHATLQINSVIEDPETGEDLVFDPIRSSDFPLEIVQMSGKGNDEPIEKYRHMIGDWIRHILTESKEKTGEYRDLHLSGLSVYKNKKYLVKLEDYLEEITHSTNFGNFQELVDNFWKKFSYFRSRYGSFPINIDRVLSDVMKNHRYLLYDIMTVYSTRASEKHDLPPEKAKKDISAICEIIVRAAQYNIHQMLQFIEELVRGKVLSFNISEREITSILAEIARTIDQTISCSYNITYLYQDIRDDASQNKAKYLKKFVRELSRQMEIITPKIFAKIEAIMDKYPQMFDNPDVTYYDDDSDEFLSPRQRVHKLFQKAKKILNEESFPKEDESVFISFKEEEEKKEKTEEQQTRSGLYTGFSWSVTAGLEDFLRMLGVSENIQKFILEQTDKKLQSILTNEVRKNPTISIESLKQIAEEHSKRKVYLPTNEEVSIANKYTAVPGMFQWVLINLRKLRTQTPETPQDIIQYRIPREEISRLLDHIFDWARANSVQIASYTLERAKQQSDAWHADVAKAGKGKHYEERNVVYQFKNGWTIQLVRTANDLEVEGNLLNHCVGSYAPEVEAGRTLIYSLRDPQNKPYVTMEVRPQSAAPVEALPEDFGTATWLESQRKKQPYGPPPLRFIQIFAKSNRDPKPEHKAMIGEWVNTMLKGQISLPDQHRRIEHLPKIDEAFEPETYAPGKMKKFLDDFTKETYEAIVKNDYGIVYDINTDKRRLTTLLEAMNIFGHSSRFNVPTPALLNLTKKMLDRIPLARGMLKSPDQVQSAVKKDLQAIIDYTYDIDKHRFISEYGQYINTETKTISNDEIEYFLNQLRKLTDNLGKVMSLIVFRTKVHKSEYTSNWPALVSVYIALREWLDSLYAPLNLDIVSVIQDMFPYITDKLMTLYKGIFDSVKNFRKKLPREKRQMFAPDLKRVLEDEQEHFAELRKKIEEKENEGKKIGKNSKTYDLVHYSFTPNLTVIDPQYDGTGLSGAERRRMLNDRNYWVDRSYFYEWGTTPEPHFQRAHMYGANIPKGSEIYDIAEDPERLIAESISEMSNTINLTLLEYKIKEKGYFGYKNSKSALSNAVALFYPVSVEYIGRYTGST